MRVKIYALGILFLLGQVSCSDESTDLTLVGTWVDSNSYGLQFIEFYSENQGSFGHYSKDIEKYDKFSYRLFDDKIAIDFAEDNNGETVHDFTFDERGKLIISGLTIVPENPDKIYVKRDIKTEKEDNEIILGVSDLYFDFEDVYRLQIDSVLNDSRCPIGAECIWEGLAAVRFNLIVDGNYEYIFDLTTHKQFTQDTLIHGITYRLSGLTPYPKLESNVEYSDYKVKVTVEK